jgi:hypothetical protein
MKELFTTIMYQESIDVKNILRENNIDYHAREEIRGELPMLRYCIYVQEKDLDRAAELVDEGLTELESGRTGE